MIPFGSKSLQLKEKMGITALGIICTLFVLIKGDAQSEEAYCRKNNEVYDMYHTYKDIANYTIVQERQINYSKYMKAGKSFRFIKPLAPNRADSENATDIIVEEIDAKHGGFDFSCIYTCFYREEKDRDGMCEKKAVSRIDRSFRPEKSILIPLSTIKNKEAHDRRIEEARGIKKGKELPKEWEKINRAIDLLSRSMNRGMCKKYLGTIEQFRSIQTGNYFFINDPHIQYLFKKHSESKWPSSMFTRHLYCQIVSQLERYRKFEVFLYNTISYPLVDEILKKKCNALLEKDQARGIEELDKEFTQNKEYIAMGIECIEERCRKYRSYPKQACFEELDTLIEEVKEQTVVHINTLTKHAERPYINASMFSGGLLDYNTAEELEDRAAPWNKELVNLLAESMYAYARFTGNIQMAIEKIQRYNRRILSELNRKERKEHFLLCCYAERFKKAFAEIDKKVRQKLKDQSFEEWKNYSGQHKSEEEIDQINKEVLGNLVDTLLDINMFAPEEEKKRKRQKIKEKIHLQLKKIYKCYIVCESPREIKRALYRKKEQIKSALLDAVIDGELYNLGNKDITVVRTALEIVVEKIASGIVCRSSGWAEHSVCKALKKAVHEEEEYLRSCGSNAYHMLELLICFFNKFGYNSQCIEDLVKRIEEIRKNRNSIGWLLDKKNEDIIIEIMEHIYSIYRYIMNLSTYDEIWQVPAVLYLVDSSSSKDAPITSIIYRSGKEEKICKKTIKCTDSNLEAFRRARTLEEIEAIEGETISIDG